MAQVESVEGNSLWTALLLWQEPETYTSGSCRGITNSPQILKTAEILAFWNDSIFQVNKTVTAMIAI